GDRTVRCPMCIGSRRKTTGQDEGIARIGQAVADHIQGRDWSGTGDGGQQAEHERGCDETLHHLFTSATAEPSKVAAYHAELSFKRRARPKLRPQAPTGCHLRTACPPADVGGWFWQHRVAVDRGGAL